MYSDKRLWLHDVQLAAHARATPRSLGSSLGDRKFIFHRINRENEAVPVSSIRRRSAESITNIYQNVNGEELQAREAFKINVLEKKTRQI